MAKGDGLGTMNPKVEVQEPQCPEDKHGPGYDNDVPANSWLRSDGTKKPGFDKRKH